MIISSTVLNLSWLDINFIDNLEILTNLKIIHLSHVFIIIKRIIYKKLRILIF